MGAAALGYYAACGKDWQRPVVGTCLLIINLRLRTNTLHRFKRSKQLLHVSWLVTKKVWNLSDIMTQIQPRMLTPTSLMPAHIKAAVI